MAVWSFVLTDMRFQPIGELLNTSQAQVMMGLNRVSTCSLTLRMDNPQVPQILANLGYIKGYRDGVLRFYGPIISVEESAERDTQTLQVNAAGIEWVLSKRLAGKTQDGVHYSVATDRAQIMADLINQANALNETHIDTSTGVSAASKTTYQSSPFKLLSEVLVDLSATLDGFDWIVTPYDNVIHTTTGTGSGSGGSFGRPGGSGTGSQSAGKVSSNKIGLFHAAPTWGNQQPEAVFEYGTGRHNVVSYKRTVSRETQANLVYHLIDSDPNNTGTSTISGVSSSDAASQTTWGWMEDVAQADIIDQGLRQALVSEHVRIRRQPRSVIDVQPHVNDGSGRVPTLGLDYDVGDAVKLHIVVANADRLDGWVRVWGVTAAIDNSGMEALTLSLSDDGTS